MAPLRTRFHEVCYVISPRMPNTLLCVAHDRSRWAAITAEESVGGPQQLCLGVTGISYVISDQIISGLLASYSACRMVLNIEVSGRGPTGSRAFLNIGHCFSIECFAFKNRKRKLER